MDDATQLLALLSHAYGAQSPSSRILSPITKSTSSIRVSGAQGSAFENLLISARDVGHELLGVLASKLALESMLDQLACGLFMVTADLKVLSQNRAARELVDDGNGLTVIKYRLACMDGRSHQRLEQRIQRLRSKGDPNSASFRVVRGCDVPDLQLHIVALVARCQLPPMSDAPAFCIWAFEPKAYRHIDCGLLREMHGLTETEAKVTAALFRGLSIEEAASELAVSANTIKTHLKHTFQKCEVRSQAELLQMLALGPR